MPRHPPWLHGKEIGKYYAKRNRQNNHGETSTRNHSTTKTSWRFHKNLVKYFIPPTHEIEISEMKTCEIKLLLEDLPQNIFRSNPSVNKATAESNYNHIEDSDFKRAFLKIITGSIEEKLNATSHKKIVKNNSLDVKYAEEVNHKRINSNEFKRMFEERKRLPSFQKRDEILKIIHENQVIVISGETGCGKTTQVAQFIIDDYIASGKGSECKVVCTQPRRISAIAVAERVAQERAEICGSSSVGYQIRLERKLPRASGSILFCTAGILLKQMEDDPYLSDVSHLILDEIHERDIISDFLIALIKIVIERRSDLKLILMSATLNSDQFSEYYNNCPKINIPGFTYPVQTFYLEDILTVIRHTFQNSRPRDSETAREFYDYIVPYVNNLKHDYSDVVCQNLKNPNSEDLDLELIYKLVLHICKNESDGAILIFLPGLVEIQKLYTSITSSNQFPRSRYLVIALHSKMSSVQQREVFDVPPKGVRKIVIATNIAETSITINDVVHVIDSGRIKIENYDIVNNIQTLKNQWVSLANASQRKGRAGRVQPGKCYYLFTRGREKLLETYQKPEILRTKLENVVLNTKILQLGDTADFLDSLMDKPEPRAIGNAIRNLQDMNAIDGDENLTPLGYQLAKLPIDPQLGKMILFGAWFSCLDPILSIATCLDFKDPFLLPLENEQAAFRKKCELANGCRSDHLLYAETLKQYENVKRNNGDVKQFCWAYFLSSYTLKLLETMKQQFADYLYDMNFISNNYIKSEEWNINSENMNLIKAIVCGCLYPKVAIIRKFQNNKNKRGTIVTAECEKVDIHLGSLNKVNFDAPFLVYYRKLKSSNIYLHDTTFVDPLHLIFFCGKFDVEDIGSQSLINISKMLQFKCGKEPASIIQELRKKLDDLIEYKISHPGIIYWMEENEETSFLRVIVEFLTAELKSVKNSGTTDVKAKKRGVLEQIFFYS